MDPDELPVEPIGQSRQEPLPTVDLNVPEGHAVHAVPSGPVYPGGQGPHTKDWSVQHQLHVAIPPEHGSDEHGFTAFHGESPPRLLMLQTAPLSNCE